MAKDFKKIRNRPRKLLIKQGMHHLLKFFSEVETRIDEVDGINKERDKTSKKKERPISILDVWESLEKFLGHFIYASASPIDMLDMSIELNPSGAGDKEIEVGIINMGGIKLTINSNDLFLYYGLLKHLQKRPFTGKLMHFYFLGEERKITTKINYPELETTLDGRSISEKSFIKNSVAAIKDNFYSSQIGAYKLESSNQTEFILRAYLEQEKALDHLFSLPPALTRFNERKVLIKDDKYLEEELLFHHAEFRVPGINFLNSRKVERAYTLNEVIRSFIINYGISFGSFDSLTKCFTCGKIILPKKKAHQSFCSQRCRSINHKDDFGEKNFACLERQRQWFSYHLTLRKNKGKKEDEEQEIVYATIDTSNCRDCERYWQFEKIPGGICDVFVKKYKIENPNKEQLIHEEEVKLQKKIAAQEKALVEELSKTIKKSR